MYNNTINAFSDITPLMDANRNTIAVYFVLKEAVVTNQDSKAYQNVVRKILPTPSGSIVDVSWPKNSTKSFTASWKLQNIADVGNLEVVVFVQNIKTKEIYQSSIVSHVDFVTDVYEFAGNKPGLGFTAYPNPTNAGFVNLFFSEPLANEYQVAVYNNLGELMKIETLPPAGRLYRLDLKGLDGVFYIQLRDCNEIIDTRKLILIK